MAKLLLGGVVGPPGPQGTPGANGSDGPQGIAGPSELTTNTDIVGMTSGQVLYNDGGKVKSKSLTAADITDGVKTQADINNDVSSAIGQMSNSPININPDFKIWQRYNVSDSITFTNPSNKYVVDRYRSNGTGTVKPVASGMEISGTINTKYVLEDADFQKLNGKTLTRSWSENGTIQKETFVCNSAIIFDKTITNKTINFIKIEIGDIATPFSPRTSAEELAMCQRYFTKPGDTNHVKAIGIISDAIYFFMPLTVTMRGVPSVFWGTIGTDTQILRNVNPGDIQSGFTINLVVRNEQGILVSANKNTHGLTDATLKINSTVPYLDAEIY